MQHGSERAGRRRDTAKPVDGFAKTTPLSKVRRREPPGSSAQENSPSEQTGTTWPKKHVRPLLYVVNHVGRLKHCATDACPFYDKWRDVTRRVLSRTRPCGFEEDAAEFSASCDALQEGGASGHSGTDCNRPQSMSAALRQGDAERSRANSILAAWLAGLSCRSATARGPQWNRSAGCRSWLLLAS